MDDEANGLAGLLQELAREARQRQGSGFHPGLETLTAYHAGELAREAEAALQDHLAVCPHCSRLLLDLPAFLASPDRIESSGVEVDASWQKLRKNLPAPGERTGSASEPKARSTRRALLLAACLLIASTAVVLWMVARRSSPVEFPPTMVFLYPGESHRGAPEPPTPAILHAEAAANILVLHLAKEQPDLRFGVELEAVGARGERRVSPLGATVIDAHTLLLVLARHQLAPARYQIRVFAPEHPSAEPLGDYPIQVVEP